VAPAAGPFFLVLVVALFVALVVLLALTDHMAALLALAAGRLSGASHGGSGDGERGDCREYKTHLQTPSLGILTNVSGLCQ
jgi:hypothetical protein